MSDESDNYDQAEVDPTLTGGLVQPTGGLSLSDKDRWPDLQNPVLKLMCQQQQPTQTHDPLTIVELPHPEQLQFDLNYRGIALQTCVEPGQPLKAGAPLTRKQFQEEGNHLLPTIFSPTEAIVESVKRSPCQQFTRIKLTVTDAPQAGSPDRQNSHDRPLCSATDTLPWYCSDWQNFNLSQRWQTVRDSAICGQGGGGYQLADKANSSIETLLINAVECEPLIACDAALVKHHALEATQGILSLVELTDCRVCVIAFETGDEWQAKLVQQAISNLRQQNKNTHPNDLVDKLCKRLSIVTVPANYPQGAERVLIKTITGKILKAHELPGQYGICCTNIATCHALYHLGHTGYPALQRIVTLTGDAMYDSRYGAPINVRASYGTPFSTLLKSVGIDTGSVRLQSGGPLCGRELDSSDYSIDATTNCIVISRSESAQQTDSCIRCGQCIDVCPASLLPQQLHLAVTSNKLPLAESFHLANCLECGCCDLVCPSNIPLTRQFRQARQAVRHEKLKSANATLALQRYESRQTRLQQRDAARQEQRKQRKQATDGKAMREIRKKEIADALARARNKK